MSSKILPFFFLLFALVCYSFTLQDTKSEITYYCYTENFEDDNVGEKPASNWYSTEFYKHSKDTQYNAGVDGIAPYNYFVTDEDAQEGNHAHNMTSLWRGIQNTASFFEFKFVPSTQLKNITYWFNCKAEGNPSGGTHGGVELINNTDGDMVSNIVTMIKFQASPTVISIVEKNNQLTQIQSYNKDTWYKIHLELNWSTHKVQLFINDVNKGWYTMTNNLDGVSAIVHTDYCPVEMGATLLDNITIYVPDELSPAPSWWRDASPSNNGVASPSPVCSVRFDANFAFNETFTNKHSGIRFYENSSGQWKKVEEITNVLNGYGINDTFSFTYSNATVPGQKYWWRVNFYMNQTNPSGYPYNMTTENQTYSFTVVSDNNISDTINFGIELPVSYNTPNPPNPPTHFNATATGTNEITLTWNKSPNATKTIIRQSDTDPGSWTLTIGELIYNGTGQIFIHKNLSEASTHYYAAWSWNIKIRLW